MITLETSIQIGLAIIQTITLIALIVYVIDTRSIARASQKSVDVARDTLFEMKTAREQEIAPYIVIYFDIPLGESLIYLVIKNMGNSIAEQITFEFDPPLQSSFGDLSSQLSFLKDGFNSMAPKYEYRTLFDTSIEYFGLNLPSTYKASVSFLNAQNKEKITIEQVLDISVYNGRMYTRQKKLGDIVKQIEKLNGHNKNIVQELKNISTNLNDTLLLQNTNTVYNEINANPELWKLNSIAKLNEFKIVWRSIYGGKIDQLYGTFLRDIKNRAKILSTHLIFLTGNTPHEYGTAIPDELASIATKLLDLSNSRFYADGGQSMKKFDQLGSEITKQIEDTIDTIENLKTTSDILLP